jgi:flagellar biosynthesis protein FlhB
MDTFKKGFVVIIALSVILFSFYLLVFTNIDHDAELIVSFLGFNPDMKSSNVTILDFAIRFGVNTMFFALPVIIPMVGFVAYLFVNDRIFSNETCDLSQNI